MVPILNRSNSKRIKDTTLKIYVPVTADWKPAFNQRLSSFKGFLPSKVVFYQRSSFIKCHLPSKVIFHQLCLSKSSSIQFVSCRGSSSINGVFRQWLSSIIGCFPSKLIFHYRSSLIKGCLLSKVVYHQRLSSIKYYLPSKVIVFTNGRFQSKAVFQQGCLTSKAVFHQRWSYIKVSLPKVAGQSRSK